MTPPLDPSTVIYEFASGPYFDDTQAVAQLLAAEVCFVNGRPYAFKKGDAANAETVVVFVNCNDIFAWACADGEDLPLGEVESLYRHVLKHPTWGSAMWCCKRRKEQPQAPVVRDMKEAGAWDAEMDALEPNWYDKRCRERATQSTNL